MSYKNISMNKLIINKKNERVQRAVLMMRATQYFNGKALHTITSLKKNEVINNEKDIREV